MSGMTRQVIAVHLRSSVEEAICKHGGVRLAARALRLDPAYLVRLRDGKKVNPSDATLRRLGLRKVVTVSYHRLSQKYKSE